MISEIFKALLITSLAGSVLAIVISVLRPITKKIFGYSWHYYIWLCVLFVMLMPVRFNVKLTPTPNITTQTVRTQQTVVGEQPETTENIARTAPTQKQQLLQKATVIWNRIIYNRMNILAYLWLIGATALMLLNIVRYVRLNIKIRKTGETISCPEIGEYTDRKINVRVWENVSSPFMTGVFRPTLILPKTELSKEQLHNILRHEMTHFKRHDILYKWFAELTACVHWFNPMAWNISKQIAAECEISCDMSVTRNMSGNEKMSYINTILSLLPTGKAKQLPLTTQMASSKKNLKRRFIMIRDAKKTSKFAAIISTVVAVVILSITVFASGVLSNLTKDDKTAVEKTSQYASDTPEYTIDQFFYLFTDGDFENMKKYCTQSCTNDFFGNDYVFGMKNASLQNISVVDNLSEKGFTDGEWVALVNVTMTPDENSVFDPNQTETSFYMILKQQNGRYLIDEFATGL